MLITHCSFLVSTNLPSRRLQFVNPQWSEPTSVMKSTSILPSIDALLAKQDLSGPPIAFFSPNLLEFTHVYNSIQAEPYNFLSNTYW